MRKLLFYLLALPLVPLSAQQSVSPEVAAEVIQTEFVLVSLNGSVSGLYYRSEGEVTEMQASMMGMSSASAYEGPRLLQLFENASDLNPVGEGEERPAPAVQVLLPKVDRTMLIFSFEKKGDKIPKARAVPVDTEKLKGGDYQVFNFSRQVCFLALDEEKVGIKPGQNQVVSNSSWRKEIRDMEVMLGIPDSEGKPKMVYSSIWGHRPQKRVFLFLFDKSDPNRPLEIRRMYDVPSVKAKRAKKAN